MKLTKRLLAMLLLLCMVFSMLPAMALTASAAAVGDKFEKVTSLGDLSVGDEIIFVNANGTYAMSTTQNTNNRGQKAVTLSGGKISFDSGVQAMTLEAGASTGTYAFNTGSGYLYSPSANNYVKTQATLNSYASWNITANSGGSFHIQCAGRTTYYLQYNSGNSIFSCYKDTQKDFCIYKKVAKTLSGITVSNNHRSFTVGDTFVKETVTATYSDSTTADVTNTATFSSPDMSTAGTKTVEVSYTEGGVTKNTSYDITVSAPAALSSVTVSSNHRSFFVGDTFVPETATAHYENGVSKTVTASFSSPDMSTAGTKTVEVSYTEDGVTATTSYDITVSAWPTLTYSVNGDTDSIEAVSQKPGTSVTLPGNPADIVGADENTYTFMGWLASKYSNETTAPSGLITSATYTMPAADTTLHAVYAIKDEGSGTFKLSVVSDSKTYYVGTRTGSNKYLNSVTNIADAVELGIEDGSYLYFMNGTTKTYISNKSDATDIAFVTTKSDAIAWTITESGSTVSFTTTANGNREFAYNKSSPRFAAYQGNDTNYPYKFTKTSIVSYTDYTTTVELPIVKYPLNFNPEQYVVCEDGEGNDVLSGAQFPEGTTFTLYAARDNYRFDYWEITGVDTEGMDLTQDTIELTMGTEELNVEAIFTALYKVTVASDIDNGSVSVASPADAATGIAAGTTVTLNCTPEDGYALTSIVVRDEATNDVYHTVTEAPYTFNMPAANVTVSASFVSTSVPTFTLTYSTDPADKGALSDSEGGVSGGIYEQGTEIILEAEEVAGEHYLFDRWEITGTEDFEIADNVVTVKMDADVTVVAHYVPEPTYTVTVTSPEQDGGTLAASKYSGIYAGETITLTATPTNIHFTFNGWQCTAGGASISGNSFTMPAANVTVTGSFTEDEKYTVTVTQPAAGGSIDASPKTEIYAGDTVTLTATPDTHYTFGEWQTTPSVTVGADGKFTMPESNVTVSATFVEDPKATVTFSVIGNTTLFSAAEDEYVGTQITLPTGEAVMAAIGGEFADNYVFCGWSAQTAATDSKTLALVNNPYTVPSGNITLNAVFSHEKKETTQGRDEGYYLAETAPIVNDKIIIAFKNGDNYYAFPNGYYASSNAIAAVPLTLSGEAAVKTDDNWFTVVSEKISTKDSNYYTLLKSDKINNNAPVYIGLNSNKLAVNGTGDTKPIEFISGTESGTYKIQGIYSGTNAGRGITYNGTNFTCNNSGGSPLYIFTYQEKIEPQTVETTYYNTNPRVIYKYTLTVDTEIANGSVYFGDHKTSGSFEENDKITLSYTAETGYQFDRYILTDANGNDVSATCISDSTLTMPAYNVTLSASFVEATGYTVTPSYNAQGGSISVSPVSGYEGDQITVTISPNPHWYLSTLTVDGTSVDLTDVEDTYTFEIAAPAEGTEIPVVAVFAEDAHFDLTLTKPERGIIKATYGETESYERIEHIYVGETVTLSVEATDVRWIFNAWQSEQVELFEGNTFTMPNCDVTVTASIVAEPHVAVTFHTYDTNCQSVTTEIADKYYNGDTILASDVPTPAEPAGYAFLGWYAGSYEGETAPAAYATPTGYEIGSEALDFYAVYGKLSKGATKYFKLYLSKNSTAYYVGPQGTNDYINSVSDESAAAKFGLESADDGKFYVYYLDGETKYYIGGAGTGTSLAKVSTKASYAWTVTDTDGVMTFFIGNRFLGLNTGTDPARFSTYTNTYSHEFKKIGGPRYDSYTTAPVSVIPELAPEDDSLVLDRKFSFNVLDNDELDGLEKTDVTVTFTGADSYTCITTAADGTVTYDPKLNTDGATVTFTYTVSYATTGTTSESATVTLTPAASVYFDESDSDVFSFVQKNTAEEAWQDGGWTDVTDNRFENLADALAAEQNGEFVMYSGGSAKQATVSAQNAGKNYGVKFSFAGTGFELVAATTGASGTALVTVTPEGAEKGQFYLVDTYRGYSYQEEAQIAYMLQKVDRYKAVTEEESEKTTYVKYVADKSEDEITNYTFIRKGGEYSEPEAFYSGEPGVIKENASDFTQDTSGNCILVEVKTNWIPGANGATTANYYQIPVLRVTGLDYGTYNVEIKVAYQAMFDSSRSGSYCFIFDGVSIFDPIADRTGYKYINLRDSILSNKNDFGTVDIPGDGHVHNYVWETNNDGTHTGTCECGETKTEDCSFDDGVVTVEPQVGTPGERTFTCSRCGYSYTEEIPALEGFTATFTVPDGAEIPATQTGDFVTMPPAVAAPAAYDAHSYTFVGWVTAAVAFDDEAPAEETVYAPTDVVPMDANTDFYALYTYEVGGSSNVYQKVTSEPTDWSGNYMIVSNTETARALNPTFFSGSSGEFNTTEVTVSDNKITNDDSDLVWTFTPADTDGQYYIHNSNGYLKITGTSSTNAALASTGEDPFTIGFTASSANVKLLSVNKNRAFSFYTGNKTFRTYASSNVTGWLFKQQASAPVSYYTTTPYAKTLSGYVAPTCTAEGFSGNLICPECETVFEAGETLEMLEHEFEIVEDASGKHYVCTGCGKIENRPNYVLQPNVTYSGNTQEGNAITLPTAVKIGKNYDAQSYKIVGWTTAAFEDGATNPTTYAPGAPVTLTCNTDFYPVYSYGGGAADEFNLITDEEDIESGDYVLVVHPSYVDSKTGSTANNGSYTYYALKKETVSNSYVRATAADSFMGTGAAPSTVTVTDDTIIFKVTATPDGIKLTNADETFSINNSDNNLYYDTGTASKWEIRAVENSNTFTLKNGRFMGLRTDLPLSDDMPRFRCSSNVADTSYNFYLYKSTGGDGGEATYTYLLQEAVKPDNFVVTVTPNALTLAPEGDATLTATLTNNGTSVTVEAVSYASSNTDVVEVDNNGDVLAVAPGSAIITATVMDGNTERYDGYCVVTVTDPNRSVTVNYLTKTVQVNGENIPGIYNWGTRDVVADFLTDRVTGYYTDYPLASLLALEGDSSDDTGFYLSPLGKQIHNLLQSKHTVYTDYDELWDLFELTDCIASDTGHITTIYSGFEVAPNYDHNAYNREHTWPNSKCLTSTSQRGDAADIMMLHPEEQKINSHRGNKAYGTENTTNYFDPRTDTKITQENGTNQNVRGDLARLMLQTLMRWGNTSRFYGADGVIQDRATLIQWMSEDPVDTWELARNDAVQSITGVRNIFVDYPELAFKLLGADMPANYSTPSSSGIIAQMNYVGTSKPAGYEPVTETVGTKSAAPAVKGATGTTPISGTIIGAVLIDGMGNTTSWEVYDKYGPKTGVYLEPDQALIFTLNGDKPTKLAIGAKALNGKAAKLDVLSVGETAEFALEKPIASAAEQYYDVDLAKLGWNDNGTSDVIVLYNDGEGVLDLTQLRYPATDDNLTLTITKEDTKHAVKKIQEIYGIPETNPDDIEDAPEIGFKSANLSLNSDIAINFNVDEAVYGSLENAYVVFTKALYNEAGEITGYAEDTVREADLTDYGYSFRFKGINPAELGSEVTATLYGTVDGELVKSETRTYSVLDYINNMYAKGSDAAFNTMLADLAAYGAAAQQYVGYNTANLVTDRVSAELLTCGTEDAPTLNNRTAFEENANASVEFASAYLSLRDKVTVCYKLDLSKYEGSVNDLELRIAYVDYDGSDKTVVISGSDFTEANGKYIVSFSGLNAVQMRTVLNASVYAGDTCVSDSLSYSIESYAAAKAAGNDALADLVLALMRYGDSACAVFEK